MINARSMFAAARVPAAMATAAAALASAASALEVQKPVDFLPAGVGQYALTINDGPIVIDRVWREIFLNGQLIAQEEIGVPERFMKEPVTPPDPPRPGRLQEQKDLRPIEQKGVKQLKPVDRFQRRPTGLPAERKGVVVASVPVDAESFRKQKNGVYAQKLYVSAHWMNAGNGAFTTHTWTHMSVREGRPTPISIDEYSRAVDPPSKGLGTLGEPIEIRTGIQGPSLPPLKREKDSDDAAVKLDPRELERMRANQAEEKEER